MDNWTKPDYEDGREVLICLLCREMMESFLEFKVQDTEEEKEMADTHVRLCIFGKEGIDWKG